MFQSIRSWVYYLRLPAAAKRERRNDFLGLPKQDPGIERAIQEGVKWLWRAQDHSASQDGGVARHFSLITGWSSSYPETTGYIIPTMLDYAKLSGDKTACKRAKGMLDWLVSIQLANGGFQGGLIDSEPVVPVTFNTGQILLGLAAGVREFGDEYREAMCRAADWLVESQDPDGCWRKYPTPFAKPGEKTYETHVAWGLLETARLEPHRRYAEAALANLSWALGLQRDNGWFDKCCLSDPTNPLTHTIGYVLRGLVEAYLYTRDPTLSSSCCKTADGLLAAIRKDGYLPGRLRADWRGAVSWVCLTGSAQIAYSWLKLYQITGETKYRDAGYAVNRYVRCTINVSEPPEIRGAVKGSFPVYGAYGKYEYLNWACKFCIDSNILEKEVRENEGTLNRG